MRTPRQLYRAAQNRELRPVQRHVSKPGITKGQHWHNTKWEFFIVVSGHGLIQERRVGSAEVLEFEVTGDKPQAIHMLRGTPTTSSI